MNKAYWRRMAIVLGIVLVVLLALWILGAVMLAVHPLTCTTR